jgi:ribonucleoside-triphosphate reductase
VIIIQIRKKNGRIDNFDSNKIRNAIISAWIQIGMPDFNKIDEIVSTVQEEIKDKENENDYTSVGEVENIVMSVLFKEVPDVAREYSSYKMDRERAKKNPTEIEKVLYVNDEVGSENANKNVELTHIKNAYLAEIPSKEMMRKLLPKDCVEAHDKSIVYFHDAAYSVRSMENCRLLNLDELLQNGCEINGVWIDKPKSFRTAVTIATQALTHITSNSYGGCTINLLHLAKFVDVSRQKIKKKYDNYNIDDETKAKLVSDDLNEEIKQGMQTFTYQNQTLCSSVGQAVFLTVSVYLNEEPKYTNDLILIFTEMLRQRIQGIKDKSGAYVNPNFPKILYFLDKDTMRGGKYYDVTKLCAECSAKRLVPDYMSVKKHMELKGICTASMGCRALLSPWRNPKTGKLQVWGRANMGVQSLNLPYIAMENNENHSEEILFENLDKYLDIAYRDMLWRINHVAKIKAKSCPLMWVYGGVSRLNPEDNLESLVYGGYYTISLGYSGLYECIKYITGENHWEGNGKILAHKLLDYINSKNDEFGEKINVSIALYGTPSEVLTTKFADACLRDFGQVGDGTQRHYLTNSYHVPVFENMDAFTKLTEEAQFSDKTTGGSISYVEVPNLSNNLDAVLEVIEHIGNTCLYAELNSEVSQCENPDCMFSGYDFKKIQDGGTLKWQCPKCGETERVRTSYRVCGYISNLNQLTVGRASDIHDRKKHLN